MTIYSLVNESNKYFGLWPSDKSLFDPLYDLFLNCQSLSSAWIPLKCIWNIDYDDRRQKRIKVADFTRLAISAPVFFPRGWAILKPLIGHEVEALSLETPIGPAFAINILGLIDALNHSACECSYYTDGKIMQVKKYMFLLDKVANVHIFRVPECYSTVFVTDTFKHLFELHNLTGARFTRVWDSNVS